MIVKLTQHSDAVTDLCRRFGASSLSVFGSVASASFDPTRGDVDFHVRFDPLTGRQL